MSTVVPYTHMQYARRLRRIARETNVPEALIRATFREGLAMLASIPARRPESVAYDAVSRFAIAANSPQGAA